MDAKREHLNSAGLLVLRVGIGCLMLVHGIAKIRGYSDMVNEFPDPIGLGSQLSLILAIGAEAGCSLLLIAGIGTRLAAIPLAFTMGVALFFVHAEDPWNVKELAAVFLLVYVSLMLLGPGRFSVDHVWWTKRTNTEPSTAKDGQ